MRLADEIAFSIGDRTVCLLPSLRGALRIAREFGGFGPVLSGIRDGSITIISRVIREGQSTSAEPLPDPLFEVGDAALYWNIVALQAPALQLVMGWMMLDPDAEAKPASPSSKPVDPVEEFEALFGFATGILRWTPAEAWAATPGEIRAAWRFRQEAFMPAEERAKKEREERLAAMSVADRVRMTFANIGTRSEADAG